MDQAQEAHLAAVARQSHVPVLRERILDLFAPALEREGAIHVDGTLGMGGHAEAILDRFEKLRLIGIDRDPQALELAAARLERFGDRVQLVRAVNSEIPRVLDDLGIPEIDGCLVDLGLSSLQIDHTERGFSYATDAPLDMRMGPDAPLSAAEVVNQYSADDLVRIFRGYGEERQSARIAQRIVARRAERPFATSADLVEVVTAAIPAAVRSQSHGHPAKRVFQALRIEVNGELDALAALLPGVIGRLAVGGRFVVLAYHSLEDRLVKTAFTRATSDDVPPELPVVPDHLRARFVALTRGAEKPTTTEIQQNPRAASARLRAIECIREAA